MNMNYQIDNHVTDQDKARVKAGFAAHALENIGAAREGRHWVVRDARGDCIAYLELVFYDGQSYIKTLWVDEAQRGEGLAKHLMGLAEGFAHDASHSIIWVDTLAFQAPEFYKKRGYTVVAEVPNYSCGHARIFLSKRLGSAG